MNMEKTFQKFITWYACLGLLDLRHLPQLHKRLRISTHITRQFVIPILAFVQTSYIPILEKIQRKLLAPLNKLLYG